MQDQVLSYFLKNPQKLFLVDALGAALSSLLLYAVLPKFPEVFVFPADVLAALAAIAFALCLYSTCCALLLKQKQGYFLKALAGFNFLYSLLTLGLLWIYRDELSAFDVGYFVGECFLLWYLVRLEWIASKRLT